VPNSKRHSSKGVRSQAKKRTRPEKKKNRKVLPSKSDGQGLSDLVPQDSSPSVKRVRKSSSTRTKKPPRSSSSSSSSKSKTPSPKTKRKRTRSPKNNSKRNRGPSLLGQFCALLFGLFIGVLSCIGLMYHQAENDVELWLNPMVIPPPQQKLYTAPLRFAQGQSVSISQMRELLLDAGYVAVDSDPNGGSFSVFSDRIVLRNDAGELHQLFVVEDRIAEIRKKGVLVSSMRTQPIVLYTLQAKDRKRRRVSIADIPLAMQRGVVAVEDSRFYEHEGIDPIGVLRAIFINSISQSKSQGASTITQQIVKNLILLDPEKTYKRKIRELLRAVALERSLMKSLDRTSNPKQSLKDRLLEIYLNEVYLGHVNGKEVRGVSEGAEIFFGKPVQKLSLGEAATLAGIISSPNTYSPVRHLEKAQERRDIALMRMEKMEFISGVQKASALKKTLVVEYRPKYKRSPWFVDYMLSRIETENIAQSDISTSLDPLLQLQAEQSVQEGLLALEKKYPKAKGSNAALVVVRNRDASIVAMVGGRDYRTSSFNRAIYAKRQVGSIAKPFWVALAMEQDADLLPGCWVPDQELSLGTGKHRWTPKNYDKRFVGAISLRKALATSRNIPFVHLYQSLNKKKGVSWIKDKFGELGLVIPPYPSAALGSFVSTPLDIARALTVFTNEGFLPSGKRWVSSTTSSLTVDMMRSVMVEGTGRSIEKYAPERYVYGKSGTTDGGRDAWFVGFDKTYTIAVWVGFDKERSLGLGGATAALPIFGRFVDKGGLGQEDITLPKEITYQNYCMDAPDCVEKEPDLMPKGRMHNPRCTLDDADLFAVEEEKGFWSSLFSF
jgi:penicillin-binding protein 1B